MTDRPVGDRNRQTVAAYDAYAVTYARNTDPTRSPPGSEALERFIAAAGPDARVLEVGSGPGWDADLMEARGLSLRRTDVSQGFIAVQAGRGKTVEPLDLISDDLDGPWDGLVVLYVIQHIEKALVEDVIARMAEAIRPGGVLLFSFQEGDESLTELGSDGGAYLVVRWPRDEMVAGLARHGLIVEWERQDRDTEGLWTTVIARRS